VRLLENILPPFPRLSYDEAVAMLTSDRSQEMVDERVDAHTAEKAALETEIAALEATTGGKEFERRKREARAHEIRTRLTDVEEALRNLPVWKESARNFRHGNDLGGSDETILTWYFDRPVIVHRYPAAVKAFYMKRDPEDMSKALAMDVLAPEGYGEIIGGSQREDNLDFLLERIREHDLPQHVFEWFLDLRRYGSVPHAGFGLGVERTVAWICGLDHVRETIPFARMIYRNTP
jgi:asparaginyl-tRNA synthetase